MQVFDEFSFLNTVFLTFVQVDPHWFKRAGYEALFSLTTPGASVVINSKNQQHRTHQAARGLVICSNYSVQECLNAYLSHPANNIAQHGGEAAQNNVVPVRPTSAAPPCTYAFVCLLARGS